VGKGGVESLGNEPLAEPLDRPVPASQRLGHPPVLPAWAVLTLIGQKQDAGAGDGPGRSLAGAGRSFELLPLVGGQDDDESLRGHDLGLLLKSL
jgi:hypothetical protein